jgi:hypothetical protein
MKYIIAITFLSAGCVCTGREEAPPVILPEQLPEGFLVPLENEGGLLYHYPNIARKSVTKEDYFPSEEVV